MYEHLMTQDGFALLSKRKKLITSTRPIHSACVSVDEASVGRKTQ